MRVRSAVRPDVASFGYATFLSVNATSIWGGVFPYLPADLVNPLSTITFYTVQLAAYLVTFLIMMAAVWLRPQYARGAHVLSCGAALSCGALLLVAGMYVESAAFFLVIASALLIGMGAAGFMVGWQRVFASYDAARGNLALIKGTGISALIYFAICLIPKALAAYLVPLVLVPLAGLCLFIAAKDSVTDQPMFNDVPREHATVYRNALRESALPALSVGALGFCSGAIRFLAVTHEDLLSAINVYSMFALLAVIAAFFVVWWRRTIQIDLMDVYRMLFPVAATCLVALPFVGATFTAVASAVAYACFMLACLLMMMHCGQISRDSGINPVLLFAFYSFVAYALQLVGYLAGYASGSALGLGVEKLSFVSLLALYVLLLAALLGRRVSKLHTNRLEFLMLAPERAAGEAPAQVTAEVVANAQARQVAPTGGKPARPAAEQSELAQPGEPQITDRLSKRCLRAAQLYGLSGRETEVMELIARGFTGPAIADMLFISENTMRTHNKRIYAKLGIHKKQELLELLDKL